MVILPADIAELELASANHVVAPLGFLNPELTPGTLFIPCTLSKLIELLIVFRNVFGTSVLAARHPNMVFGPTLEAIKFRTQRTSEGGLSNLKAENVLTSDGRTPAPRLGNTYIVS